MPPSVKPPSTPLSPPVPAPAPSVVHVFRAGNSLARIASAYGVTVEQLIAANNLARANSVGDGRRLVIPLDRPAAGAPTKPRPDRSG